jgi:hypothetical protein
MKRSTLNKIILLWTAGWMCMLLSGCTTTWTQEASNIISLLGPAITSILAILAAFGVGLSPAVASNLQKWSADAQTGLSQVATLINQYNAAAATAKPGILTEIQTLLGVISTNLANLLPTIKVTNPSTQAKIEAIVQAFQSELSALIALVPAVQGQSSMDKIAKAFEASGLKTAHSFRADFNAKVDAFGPEAKQYELK